MSLKKCFFKARKWADSTENSQKNNKTKARVLQSRSNYQKQFQWLRLGEKQTSCLVCFLCFLLPDDCAMRFLLHGRRRKKTRNWQVMTFVTWKSFIFITWTSIFTKYLHLKVSSGVFRFDTLINIYLQTLQTLRRTCLQGHEEGKKTQYASSSEANVSSWRHLEFYTSSSTHSSWTLQLLWELDIYLEQIFPP